jgi:hypothetical protein
MAEQLGTFDAIKQKITSMLTRNSRPESIIEALSQNIINEDSLHVVDEKGVTPFARVLHWPKNEITTSPSNRVSLAGKWQEKFEKDEEDEEVKA